MFPTLQGDIIIKLSGINLGIKNKTAIRRDRGEKNLYIHATFI
jgi:hypothetical protein